MDLGVGVYEHVLLNIAMSNCNIYYCRLDGKGEPIWQSSQNQVRIVNVIDFGKLP